MPASTPPVPASTPGPKGSSLGSSPWRAHRLRRRTGPGEGRSAASAFLRGRGSLPATPPVRPGAALRATAAYRRRSTRVRWIRPGRHRASTGEGTVGGRGARDSRPRRVTATAPGEGEVDAVRGRRKERRRHAGRRRARLLAPFRGGGAEPRTAARRCPGRTAPSTPAAGASVPFRWHTGASYSVIGVGYGSGVREHGCEEMACFKGFAWSRWRSPRSQVRNRRLVPATPGWVRKGEMRPRPQTRAGGPPQDKVGGMFAIPGRADPRGPASRDRKPAGASCFVPLVQGFTGREATRPPAGLPGARRRGRRRTRASRRRRAGGRGRRRRSPATS